MDLATDDVAYLTQLGLVRGHLNVGYDLFRQGDKAAARSHMKHPGDELYAPLVPAFKARRAPAFDAALSRLATLVEGGAPQPEVDAAYAELEAGIAAAARGAEGVSLRDRLAVVARLVRTAGEEYAIGVKDGEVVNAHEYQDALGFVRVAREVLRDAPTAERARAGDRVADIEKQLAALDRFWPSVVPPKTVEGKASELFATASRIELAAGSLR